METLVLVVHILIAIFMIVLIMLQQGKGAEAGASFGSGASGTVFGGAGSAGFLTKLTAGLALLFFVTSLSLAVYAKSQSKNMFGIPLEDGPAETQGLPDLPTDSKVPPAPVSSDLPVAPAGQ